MLANWSALFGHLRYPTAPLSEAINTLVTWFFTAMDADVLIAVTQDANQRSTRLLERGGAELTGSFEQYGALQRHYEFRRHTELPPSVGPTAGFDA